MKRLLTLSVAASLLLGGISLYPAHAAQSETGNGAPSGSHYTLNLIGVPKSKSTDMTGDNGRRMFVPLDGRTRINLSEGDFQVLDANASDGRGSFQLPNPDADLDGTTSYSVYVRALGKPGGSATMQSCYEDGTGTWCAVDFAGGVDPITVTRSTGKSSFTNVSKDLLYIDFCAEWDLEGACLDVDQLPLFSDATLGYYWDYDNHGLKLAQLRFYEVETVTGWDPSAP